MITDKMKWAQKGISLVLAFLTLALALVSCRAWKDEDPPFELLSDSESEATFSGCVLVIPAHCSSSLYEATNSLAEDITRKTGVPTRVRYDHERWERHDKDFLILLGLVDHAEMREALRGLKAQDYICRGEETTLLLGGKSDEATILAIRQFTEELLPHATASCLISSEAGFTVFGTYAMGSILLNGFDLDEYTIVYPDKQVEFLGELAETLQERIAARSGYHLAVQTEEDFKDRGRSIRLSVNHPQEAGSSATILPTETGITLSAKNSFGVSVAASELLELLTNSSSGGEHSVTLNVTRTVSYEQVKARLATICTDENGLTIPSFLSATLTPIQDRVPNAVFFAGLPEEREVLLTQTLLDYQWMGEDEAKLLRHKDGEILWIDSLDAYRVGSESRGFLILFCGEDELCEQTIGSLQEKSDLPIVILCYGQGEGTLEVRFDSLGVRGVFCRSYVTETRETRHVICYATDGAFLIDEGEIYESVGYVDLTVERKSAWN